MTVARKPGRWVARVSVGKLAKWNFKLLVYYAKLCELRIRPVFLDEINDNALSSIEDHHNISTLRDNIEESLPVITQILITNNIDLVWEIVNGHLEAIYGTKVGPVLWCVYDTFPPKHHGIFPTLDYISIDEELVARFPMIIDSNSGSHDEATANDIHVRDCTAVYCTCDNIILRDLSHIFSESALWVHAKCDVKTQYERLAYKQIYNNFSGRKLLGKPNASCETMIGRLEYHDKKKIFNW